MTTTTDYVDVRDTLEAAILFAHIEATTAGGYAGQAAVCRWIEVHGELPRDVRLLKVQVPR